MHYPKEYADMLEAIMGAVLRWFTLFWVLLYQAFILSTHFVVVTPTQLVWVNLQLSSLFAKQINFSHILIKLIN
jgi:magnesium-transporting ATPase (P-type)